MQKHNLPKKIFWLSFALFIGIGINGCSNREDNARNVLAPPIKVTVDPKLPLIEKLDNYIAELPNQKNPWLVIAIPKSKLFNQSSANLSPKAPAILNDVAALINYYDKESVEIVNSFSFPYSIKAKNSNDAFKISQALTKKQANKIVQYLWGKRINAQIIYAQSQNSSAIKKLLTSLRAKNQWYKHKETKYLLIKFKKLLY